MLLERIALLGALLRWERQTMTSLMKESLKEAQELFRKDIGKNDSGNGRVSRG